jgi:hypothetical protein
MALITVKQLSDLCGYDFDDSDKKRAAAIINMVQQAAEGLIGYSVTLETNSLVFAVISSASLRMMQNKPGVATETIGNFTAQYPMPGRLFTSEEMSLLANARSTGSGSVRITTTLSEENETN